MRIAIVSDIHGNRTAWEAVLADLRQTAPDLILLGGDLADTGSSPAAIVDHIRDLGWPGVVGNTDEMLFRPASLHEFARQSPHLQPLFGKIEERAAATRAALGEERLTWLRDLPPAQFHPPIALVHASPATAWRAPTATAPEPELASVYEPLHQPVAVYAHIHWPYIRQVATPLETTLTVANTGSVGLPYDGDPRASYLLIDDAQPSIRRVAYDVDRERRALLDSPLPHGAWIASMLTTASFQMP